MVNLLEYLFINFGLMNFVFGKRAQILEMNYGKR